MSGAGAAALALPQRAFASADEYGRARQDYFSGEALYRDVVAYASFGEHRTATDADVRTSRWLAEQLAAAGAEARLVPWRSQQFFIRDHALSVAGSPVESFPLWWPRPTGPEPLVASLAAIETGAGAGALAERIGLVVLPPVGGAQIVAGNGVAEIVAEAAAQGARALVLVIRHRTGEIVALNAMAGLRPWPIPVLQVGQRDEAQLAAAAAAGESVSFLLDGALDYRAEAFEVVGTAGSGEAQVVVSTPSSGWFRCAGERGPGIALWLALARWAAASPIPARFTFVASSGHELDSVGIRHFLAYDAPPPAAVATWLHLGAGIATYDYELGADGPRRLDRPFAGRRLMTNQEELVAELREAFADLAGLEPILTPEPGGEMVAMADMGYRVWGFAGGSVYHHIPSDLPERTTGPELLEPVARAVVRTLEQLVERR